MSEEKFDFSSLFGATGFPHLKILVKVAKEQLAEGIPMENVLKESLEFAVSEATRFHTQLVVEANKQVSEGLYKLALLNSWPNLGRIADHALELEEKVLREDSPELYHNIAELTALRKQIIHTSISELGKMFKEEWLDENYPVLKESMQEYNSTD